LLTETELVLSTNIMDPTHTVFKRQPQDFKTDNDKHAVSNHVQPELKRQRSAKNKLQVNLNHEENLQSSNDIFQDQIHKLPSDVNVESAEPSSLPENGQNNEIEDRNQSSHPDAENSEIKSGSNESEDSTFLIQQIQDDRKSTTAAAAEKLEMILEDVKHTTQKLLQEIDIYLKSVEDVTIDFCKCQESQYKNSKRLGEMESEVVGACSGGFTNMVMDAVSMGRTGGM